MSDNIIDEPRYVPVPPTPPSRLNVEGVPTNDQRDAVTLSEDFRADVQAVGVFFGGAVALALFATNLKRGFHALVVAAGAQHSKRPRSCTPGARTTEETHAR